VELIQRIEAVIGKKMDQWVVDKEEVALLRERVDEAGRVAASELREQAKEGKGKKRKRGDGGDGSSRDRDDDVVEAGMPSARRGRRR